MVTLENIKVLPLMMPSFIWWCKSKQGILSYDFSDIYFKCSQCFVSNHQIQSLKTFTTNAERNHKGLCYAKVNDDLWSLYVFELVQAGRQTSGWRMKLLVTCVGRQPFSSTWVLGPNVQVNSSGNLIPEDQQYYWYHIYSYVAGMHNTLTWLSM